jgi:plastocyanin
MGASRDRARSLRPAALGAALLGALLATALLSPAVAAPGLGEAPAGATDPPVTRLISQGPCTTDNAYEDKLWTSDRYGDRCKRLKYAFGPIVVRPGQNDGVVQPVTIEKPTYDGFAVRFKPDLVDATGTTPPVRQIHLHHGVWISLSPDYGNGTRPFFAAGEEKTILTFPDGYGMPVGARDTWLMQYMVHNAVQNPAEVWLTWDLDYVAATDAPTLGISPAKPVWLDVQRGPVAPGAPDTQWNPVFNVHKGFGHHDAEFGQLVCTWPKENCARHDAYGDVSPQQGEPATVAGANWTVPSHMAGTLIQMGGHVHPGGLRDEVSLVRSGVERRIFNSDAVYWDRADPSRAGGPANTWDFSMTVTGASLGWKVKIRPGDVLRLNAVIDSETASWYENMGIVMGLVAPNDPHGPEGVDVFTDDVAFDAGAPVGSAIPSGRAAPSCTPDLTSAQKTLCLGGQPTHGHLAESSDFGGCPPEGCAPLPTKEGPIVSEIRSTAFSYGDADFAFIGRTGIPRVRVGQPVRFFNTDTFAGIWHTFTRCKEPCTGTYGLDYPTADGSLATDDVMDFDSTQIGYGLFYSPASGQIGGHKDWDEVMRDGMYFDFTPARTGTYTFWCRIHPSMRGAIQAVE